MSLIALPKYKQYHKTLIKAFRSHLAVKIRAIIMIQRVMKVYLKKKRANLILLEGDSPKRVNNTKLQDELNLASNPDKRNSTKSMKPQKISNQLNNLNVNDENDKSKMIEQLMEISIVTKHTKG